jgi:hypothetical protein
LEAADVTITGLAGSANERKLRALVAEYKAAPPPTRDGILRRIAKLAPLAVNRGSFAEPVSLNETQLDARLSASTGASGGSATATHAVNAVLASIRGAGFQTLVGTATGAVGTIGGPLSVAQYLNDDAKSLNEAGLTGEANRLLRAEEALPPAPAATQAAYAQQLESVVATANSASAAAVAALRSEHSSPLYGNRVNSAAMKLELTPPATFASFSAAVKLRPVLKNLAVNLNVLLVGGHHVAELNEQLRTLGKTVAAAVTGLTGPGSDCGACTTAEAAHFAAPERVTSCAPGARATSIIAHAVSCAVAVSALETYEGSPCGHSEGPCGQSGVEAVDNGQSAVECNRAGTKLACKVFAGGLGGKPIGRVDAVAEETEAQKTEAQAAQCGTQSTEEFSAFDLTAKGMSCSEATEALKAVRIEDEHYQSPPEYECSSTPATRGVEETTCTSGERSFSWLLREP